MLLINLSINNILRFLIAVVAIIVIAHPIVVFGQNSNSAIRWQMWLQERKKEPDLRQFPIFAWASFGYIESKASEADFLTYVNAGFTEVQSPLKTDFLDVASKNGLHLILGTWENTLSRVDRFERLLDVAVHNHLTQILILKDEADLSLVDVLGKLHQSIYEGTPSRVLPLMTVLPAHASESKNKSRFDPIKPCILDGSYCDFIKKIITVAKPSALMSTLYPIFEDGTYLSNYYEQLAELRDLTSESKIGYFGFIIVTPVFDGWIGKKYRHPNRADLYLQAYSLLAYNAKGLAYYSYRTKPQEIGKSPLYYDEGIVSAVDSTPTEIYPLIRELNCEISALGPIFLRLDAVNTFMPDKSAMKGISSGYPFPLVDVHSSDVLMAEMRSTETGDHYVLFVNTLIGNVAKDNELSFSTQNNFFAMRVMSDANCKQSSLFLTPINNRYNFTLSPGMGLLIRFYKP